MNNSPTPRTDAQSLLTLPAWGQDYVPTHFARELEREVAELREALEKIADKLNATRVRSKDVDASYAIALAALFKPHAQGGTPNERSSEGTNRRGV